VKPGLKRIEAIFYRTAAGGEPVRDWLKEMRPIEDRKQIGVDIKTVEFWWPIGMPVCRPLGDGLYEVRSNLAGAKIARVSFISTTGEEWSLLHGFIKKTQKTPQADLQLAQKNKRLHEAELKERK
jgi:phage-related protein